MGELIAWTEGRFRELGLSTPRLDAELLLAAALGTSRIDLYCAWEKPVEAGERDRFRELVKRRSRREPVAYLLGEREFRSLAFRVGPGVLVPRPETEHVVDAALEVLAGRPGPELRALDLGTGSGNIAVALAVERSELRVDAVDISADALSVAEDNAARHGVAERVALLRGDLFGPLDPEASYDLVASNPPYVQPDEFERLPPDVHRHEPRCALVDPCRPEADGLGVYRAIAGGALRVLRPGGALVAEVGDGMAGGVEGVMQAAGLEPERTVDDLAGIPRVVVARRPLESC